MVEVNVVIWGKIGMTRRFQLLVRSFLEGGAERGESLFCDAGGVMNCRSFIAMRNIKYVIHFPPGLDFHIK